MDEHLEHVGVPGMKWGIRKGRQLANKIRRRPKPSAEDVSFANKVLGNKKSSKEEVTEALARIGIDHNGKLIAYKKRPLRRERKAAYNVIRSKSATSEDKDQAMQVLGVTKRKPLFKLTPEGKELAQTLVVATLLIGGGALLKEALR